VIGSARDWEISKPILSNYQLYDLRPDVRSIDKNLSDRHGQFEAARAGAAGIDEQYAVCLRDQWLVRMAADDDARRCVVSPIITMSTRLIQKDSEAELPILQNGLCSA
jgi:hypothetical protein